MQTAECILLYCAKLHSNHTTTLMFAYIGASCPPTSISFRACPTLGPPLPPPHSLSPSFPPLPPPSLTTHYLYTAHSNHSVIIVLQQRASHAIRHRNSHEPSNAIITSLNPFSSPSTHSPFPSTLIPPPHSIPIVPPLNSLSAPPPPHPPN